MQDRTSRFRSFQRHSRLAAGFAFGAVVVLATACDPGASTRNNNTEVDSSFITGRLSARYKLPTASVIPGLRDEQITPGGRPFGLFVPANYDPSRKWPLAVLLHGLGGSGEGMALEFSEFADASGLILVAPNSYFQTWDLIYSATQVGNAQFGPDLTFIDDLLEWSFDHLAVDSARVGIAGFDDGGIYSIWLGLKNGDLFSRVAAFSPCSNVPSTRTGVPLVFVSHGIDDQVSPIDDCSRAMVPRLEGFGYAVDYVEYPTPTGNGHFMTPEVMSQAIQFLARQ
jgi:phospholipase/carboxylesterase